MKPYVGKSGVMKVSNYTVEALEAEDQVLVTACMDNGDVIPQETAKKLFSLPAEVLSFPNALIPACAGTNPEDERRLDALEQDAVDLVNTHSAERNSDFFDSEVDKLDKWADDMKTALELDLKKLDIDIKSAKTLAKKNVNLDEKLKAQRSIKDMERKRNEMRKKLYEAQDEVDARKEGLISRIEARLKQKTKLELLFVVRWKVL